jgi:hypothetical protein
VKLDFCKMDVGPIFFKEISFFDQEGKIEEQDFSFLK